MTEMLAEKASLTRRRFLERLGLAGGSALVMGAMNAWDLMGAQAGPKPALTGRPKRTRVVVLGAGLSGLVVGYELGKLGYDYQILEARDRVGGVCWTVRRGSEHTELGPEGEHQVCTFDEGLYLNSGPWRIPHFHTAVLDYCKELGVALELFVNEAEASYLYYEGAEVGPLAGKRVRLREVKSDLVGYTGELLAKAVDQGQLDLPLSAEDKERLVDFLVFEGYLDSADLVYKGSAVRGGDPYDFSALLKSGFGSRVRSILGGTGQAPMFQPVGGMDEIPRAFQRVVGSRIKLGAEVRSIRQAPEGVRIQYVEIRSGKLLEVAADYCVACMPLSVLAGVDVNLSPELTAAVKSTLYVATAKIGLQMRRRFWEEDDRIFGGHLYTNLPLGEFSYPSNSFFTRKGVLLGFYGNPRLDRLGERPVRARIDRVLEHAAKVHPQITTEFENGYCVFWDKIRYSLGGYAAGSGGGGPELAGRSGGGNRLAVLGRGDDRIVLGCAAVSTSPAWLEGAVAGAWQAVEAVHERAMRA